MFVGQSEVEEVTLVSWYNFAFSYTEWEPKMKGWCMQVQNKTIFESLSPKHIVDIFVWYHHFLRGAGIFVSKCWRCAQIGRSLEKMACWKSNRWHYGLFQYVHTSVCPNPFQYWIHIKCMFSDVITDLNGLPSVLINCGYFGSSRSEGEALLDPLAATSPIPPTVNTVEWLPYVEVQRSGDFDDDGAMNWSFKSFVFDEIKNEMLLALWEVYAERPSDLCAFLIEPLGGIHYSYMLIILFFCWMHCIYL